MALASASVRTQLLALVLLLPCFAGIMQHGHGPRSVPLAQHRHRRAHVCRASTVGSSRVQSSLGTTASTLGDTGADSAGAHADIAAWRAGPNPFDLVRPDIELLSHSIKQLLATDHAVLSMAAQHFFDRQTGKQFRPTIVVLMSRAVEAAPLAPAAHGDASPPPPDASARPSPPPLEHVPGVRELAPPSAPAPAPAPMAAPRTPIATSAAGTTTTATAATAAAAAAPSNGADTRSTAALAFASAREKQYRLAEITEMIHTASLIHDDVLDDADTRRGGAAVHKAYSNTVAVLAGDYLLARASLMMARLRNIHVVQTMARSLEALVQGEIMQLRATPEERMQLALYIDKSFFKTASLIAYSCKSAALLGGHGLDSAVTQAAYDYGYHLGLAFQIVDDMLDFTGSADALGKPKLQDMALGLATAPILYASNQFPELQRLIKRKFETRGDLDRAYALLMQSDGLARTRDLAHSHASKAVAALAPLPDSEAKAALIHLCYIVLSRDK
ncbi:hypothetical protein KFE25_012806 [Diacronema lutheri]|uniref:Solanesyl diphosphate synthase n=1 Tax=Diacronema lutheri TaxID=2081491 RepID=A0A8J6C5S2_DIALT|nr:hypothetical protein KFE25_012806 [Diacronema lutheri]